MDQLLLKKKNNVWIKFLYIYSNIILLNSEMLNILLFLINMKKLLINIK